MVCDTTSVPLPHESPRRRPFPVARPASTSCTGENWPNSCFSGRLRQSAIVRSPHERIVGIETGYAAWSAVSSSGISMIAGAGEESRLQAVKAGAIDLHYRDYEEPLARDPFARRRRYLEGALDYSSPKPTVRDAVAYEAQAPYPAEALVRNGGRSLAPHQELHRATHRRYLDAPRILMARIAVSPTSRHAVKRPLRRANLHRCGSLSGRPVALAFDFDPPRQAGPRSNPDSQRLTTSSRHLPWVQFIARSSMRATNPSPTPKYRRLPLLNGD